MAEVFERINSFSQDIKEFENLAGVYLKIGREMFNSDIGIVSHIENQKYTIRCLETTLNFVEVEAEFDLSATLCNEVILANKTIIYNDIGDVEKLKTHPAYTVLKLESYIGTPITKAGAIVGTLNFSSIFPKANGFSKEDTKVAELMASKIGSLWD